jgi:hypothetical protein
MAKTTAGYVRNVIWTHGKQVTFERGRIDRSNGLVMSHGLMFYEDQVLPSWVETLQAPIANSRTGMKQLGFLADGDPVSAQFHRNGRVIVFPHSLEWREWLTEELTRRGWDAERASLLTRSLHFVVKTAEGGIRTQEGFLPKDLIVKTAWGFMMVKDDSPSKNTLEIRLSVPDLERYLGLPEIQKQLAILTQGTMTMQQALRALVFLVNRSLEKEPGK